jgi:phospholipid/cholesterol/gamma-HCH transport system substrate-binding protein
MLSTEVRARNPLLETGGFVLLGCLSFWFLITQIAHRGGATPDRSHYDVTADFENIGGLKVGAKVSMSGVEVGRVAAISFDDHSYRATVLMQMNGRYRQIPRDSEAAIVTQGVLGGQSIGLTAGGDPAFLDDGSAIHATRSAVVLENTIGRLIAHFISHSGRKTP